MAIKQPLATDYLNNPDHALSHRVFANDGSAPVQSIVVDSSGNVGIGTTVPLEKLNVDTGNLALEQSGQTSGNFATTYSKIKFYDESNRAMAGISAEREVWGGSPHKLTFWTGDLLDTASGSDYSQRRMTIDSNGNVGIGTTEPTAYLHLKAGTASASTAPIKLTTGVSNTTAELGTIEFTDPDIFFSLTDTTVKRKAFVLDNGARLTSGKVPVATTNGRLIDSAGVSGTFTTVDLKTVTVTNGLITSIG